MGHKGFWKAAANLLSASRFILAAVWFAAYVRGDGRPALLVPIALAAAASDFADGRLARRAGSIDQFGRWLDAIADIVFILTALSCQAHAGSIPAYIPALVALLFTQYAVDSVVIFDSTVPVASRLGHWAGAFNYVLVIVLAFGPMPRLIGAIAPLIAIFYLAAIVERALNYRSI